MTLTEQIKTFIHELGFQLTGVAPVQPFPELSFYQDWIEAGRHGEMSYLERNAEKKTDVRNIAPLAKSVIVCAKIYHTDYPLSTEFKDPANGWVSRYAWGDDYHEILQRKLFDVVSFLQEKVDENIVGRVYVDTGPVVDRVYAKYAGIGWFGKNTCIINQQKGSWFFLAEIITDLELDYDEPAPDRCGSCTRCIDACPTDALLEPYLLDSRKCISYLTIELKNNIPLELRDGIGNHVFGCDICQDVCPWNRKAEAADDKAFHPRDGLVSPALTDLAGLSIEEFREKFRRNPIKRTKHKGLLRNVAVAMGNSKQKDFIPTLQVLADHEEPLIAEHAKWAIHKLRDEN